MRRSERYIEVVTIVPWTGNAGLPGGLTLALAYTMAPRRLFARAGLLLGLRH